MSEETIDYRKLAEALAEALEQRNLWIEGEEYRELVILRMRLSARVDSLAEELKAATARIAELEDAQTRWVMASERLPKVSGWYLTGLVYFLGSLYSSEVYFDAENIEPRWNNSTSDKIYCWLEGVPELPTPPEVQE